MDVNAVKQAIAARLELKTPVNAVIGFDGFVDEVVHVVRSRSDAEHYERVTTLYEFGERIMKSAGLSTNAELVVQNRKLGGNGPIFANALISYDVDMTYIGALGENAIDSVFEDMKNKSREVIPLVDPGLTLATEFEDGKLMQSMLQSLNGITWETIEKKVGVEKFIELLDSNELIGFENWTMIPYMSQIWEKILEVVIPQLKNPTQNKVLFFDLADPEKRTREDILHAMDLIKEFNKYYKTILGLNKKEACEIAELLGMEISDYSEQPLEPLAKFLAEYMDIYCLVIHPVKEACCVFKGEYHLVEGPFCAKPKLTTGAGDNFNAGFIYGIMMGLEPQEALVLGTGTSGYYVRNAGSANRAQMAAFLKDWAAGKSLD